MNQRAAEKKPVHFVVHRAFRRSAASLALLCALIPPALAQTGGASKALPGSSPSRPAVTEKAYRIGLLAGLTGKFANFGIDFKRGVDLAVEVVNKSGGIQGARIQVVAEDTENDKVQSFRLTRKLAGDKSIAAIIGPQDTASLLAIAPLLDELQILAISASVAPWKGQFNRWTFRAALPTNIGTAQFMRQLRQDLKVTTLAITYDSANDFSKAETDDLKLKAEAAGIRIVRTETYRTQDTDFSAQVTNIVSQTPDAWYLSGTLQESAAIVRQARERGYKGLFAAASPIAADPNLPKLSGGQATGMVTFSPPAVTPSSTKRETATMASAYIQKFGDRPAVLSAQGYDSVLLLVDAARRANSLTDRAAIRDALAATRGLRGTLFDYTYSGSGDNTTPAIRILRLDAKGNLNPF